MYNPIDVLRTVSPGRKKHLPNRLSSLDMKCLASALEIYSDAAKSELALPVTPVGQIGIFPDGWSSQHVSESTIMQLCMYVHRIYIHDPILPLYTQFLHLTHWPMGLRSNEIVDMIRKELGRCVAYLLRIEPLIVQGLVVVVPSELIGPQRDPVAMHNDDCYTGEGKSSLTLHSEGPPALADGLLGFLDEFLEVLVESEGPGKFAKVGSVPPRRSIGLGFRGEAHLHVRKYAQIVLPKSEEDRAQRMVNIVFNEADPIEPEVFSNWVGDESRKFVLARVEQMRKDIFLATLARAELLTSSSASRALLGLDPSVRVRDDSMVTNLLSLDLPYFDRATASSLAVARKSEVAFEDFRVSLTRTLREIASLQDHSERQRLAGQIVRDNIEVPLLRVRNVSAQLRRNLLLNCGVLIGGLAAAALTASESMFSLTQVGVLAVLAQTKLLDGVRDYVRQRDGLLADPGFFYWHAARKP